MLDQEGSTADVEQSMDDTLRETLASIRSRGADLGDEPKTEQPATDTPEAPEEKAQRLRDEQGKFAAAAPVVGEPSQPAQIATEPPAFEVPPELQRLGLKKEEAQAYMQAPQALKDAFMRRAEEMGKGIETYKSKAQFADSMQNAIGPHMQTIQSLGVSPDVAIGELLKVDNVLRYGSPEQKQQKFMELARDYGIQLQGMEMPQIDPHAHALQQRLQQVEGALKQFKTTEEQREQQALNSQLEAFKADPNHSHFDAVRGHMGSLLRDGLATDLASAYEQAVWANPVTRAAVLAKQQEAARAEADQRAKAAKAAASVNVRTRPSLPSSEPIGTMDDTIRSVLRKHNYA